MAKIKIPTHTTVSMPITMDAKFVDGSVASVPLPEALAVTSSKPRLVKAKSEDGCLVVTTSTQTKSVRITVSSEDGEELTCLTFAVEGDEGRTIRVVNATSDV